MNEQPPGFQSYGAENTCPTCGSNVRVVSSDEGTSFFDPSPTTQSEPTPEAPE